MYQGQVLTLLHIYLLFDLFPFCPFAHFISHTFSSYLSVLPTCSTAKRELCPPDCFAHSKSQPRGRSAALWAGDGVGLHTTDVVSDHFFSSYDWLLHSQSYLGTSRWLATGVSSGCDDGLSCGVTTPAAPHQSPSCFLFLPFPLHHFINFKVKAWSCWFLDSVTFIQIEIRYSKRPRCSRCWSAFHLRRISLRPQPLHASVCPPICVYFLCVCACKCVCVGMCEIIPQKEGCVGRGFGGVCVFPCECAFSVSLRHHVAAMLVRPSSRCP